MCLKSSCSSVAPSSANKVEDHVVHSVRACGRFVDFVDDDDGFQPKRERLTQYELCLRHWPFVRVRRARARCRPCGVRVPPHCRSRRGQGVDNVDFYAVDDDCRVLCVNRNTTLAFELVAVHDAVLNDVTVGERAGLFGMASTSVVLPWSTWAMMAMLRNSIDALKRKRRNAKSARSMA